MAHFAKFALPLTTVYGATQTLEGVPETIASGNSIIAANLTYDPNIANSVEALAGGNLDGDAMVRITDEFAEFSFDSYIPILGTSYRQQVGNNETAVLTINSSFNQATDADSLVIAGITLTVKPGQTMTSAQVAQNFVKYANGLTPNATLATYSGTLNPNYKVSDVQVGSSAIWQIFFEGIAPFTDYAPVTTSGTVAATLAKVSLDLSSGNTSLANRLPVADFLECSNLFQEIVTSLGLRDILDQNFKDALDYIATAQTSVTRGSSGVAKSKTLAISINALDLGDAANTALVNTFIGDMNTLNTNLNGQILNSLLSLKADINDLYATFNGHIATQDYNLAVQALKDRTAELLDQFTDWFSTFTGTLKVGDTVTFAGKSYLATADTNGLQLADIIVNQGSSAYAGQVTISTVNATIVARWTLSATSVTNKIKAVKTGGVATTDMTDLTMVLTKLVGSTSTSKQTLQPSLGYTIATIDDNLTTYTADLNALANDNPASNLSFNNLKAKLLQVWADTKVYITAIPANVTALANSAYNRINTANSTVSPSTYTIGDLVPVYKEIKFSNTQSSPDTMTAHIRKASADLIDVEKTVIITDTKFMVDITIENSKSPMFKFNGHGNIYDIVNSASLVYDIAKQKTNASFITSAETIRNVSLTPTGEGIYNNNVCFSKFQASNFDGFVHERTLTGCGNFWQATRKSHQFTLTILEEKANTDLLDSFNVEDSIGKEFTFYFEQGQGAGTNFSITMTKCVLSGYKHTSVNATAAQDLTFECTGSSTLRLF